jgi:phosphopantothenoylcysteine decarboxylase/phosphopantothenate--cysteine ligase
MMVANDVSNQTIGFNSDNNAVTVLWRDGEKILELASKASIARHIVHLIAHQTRKNN